MSSNFNSPIFNHPVRFRLFSISPISLCPSFTSQRQSFMVQVGLKLPCHRMAASMKAKRFRKALAILLASCSRALNPLLHGGPSIVLEIGSKAKSSFLWSLLISSARPCTKSVKWVNEKRQLFSPKKIDMLSPWELDLGPGRRRVSM